MSATAVEEQSYLFDLLLKIRRRKLVIALTTIVLFISVGIAIQMLPRSYTTTANVEVVAQTPRAVRTTQDVLNDQPFDDTTMGTEIALLESDNLYLDVVKQANLVSNPEFNPGLKPSRLREFTERFRAFIDTLARPDTPVENDPAKQAVADTLMSLRKHVKTSQIARSRIIQVNVTSHSNRIAQLLANTIANQYVAKHFEYRAQLSERAHVFTTQRLDELQQSASNTAQAVEVFRTENGLVAGKDSTLLQEQVTMLSNQLLDAKSRLATAESQYQALRNANPEQITKVMATETMARLRDQESVMATKRSVLIQSYGADHPVVAPLTVQLATIRGQIAAEAHRALNSMLDEVNALRGNVAALLQRLVGLRLDMAKTNMARARLTTLDAEAQTQRQLYMTFLQRSKETDEGLQFAATSVRVAAAALLPMKPSFPNNQIILPGVLFLSFVTSIGMAVWLEGRRKGVVSQTEIEAVTQISSLGMLPVRRRNTSASFEDAMEALWNRLSGDIPQVILITSALPAEGKTFVARALVETITRRHVRALLVDADMRSTYRPARKRDAGVGGGLADILGGNGTPTTAIANYADSNRLATIPTLPAGRVTDNPTRLLSHPRFATIMAELKGDYPLIVIDAPPCMVGGDAAKLAQLADSVVMVVRWNSTTPEHITAGLRQLRLKEQLAGVVLNMVYPHQAARYDASDALLFADLYRTYH